MAGPSKTRNKSDSHVRRSRRKADTLSPFASKVTNGASLWVLPVDGRSTIARRFRDICLQWEQDLGGFDHLSTARRQLVRRGASLAVQAEIIECEVAQGKTFDLQSYSTLTNTLVRVCMVLGLDITPRDVTPRLDEYLRSKATPSVIDAGVTA